MGQVPATRITLVGDGRMARHFSHYLDLSGYSSLYRTWSRRLEAAQGLSLAQAVQGSDTVLLLIRDSEIEPFIQAHPELEGKTLVHFSGALITPFATGFHPLMTFSQDLYPLETYQAVWFVCEEGGAKFGDVLSFLSNRNITVPGELKPLYHALCVLGGNFTALLWQKVFKDFEERLGIPSEAALPYLRQVTTNLTENPGGALTGPLQRRDIPTLRKNRQALIGDPFQAVYEAFLGAVAPDMLQTLQAGREEKR